MQVQIFLVVWMLSFMVQAQPAENISTVELAYCTSSTNYTSLRCDFIKCENLGKDYSFTYCGKQRACQGQTSRELQDDLQYHSSPEEVKKLKKVYGKIFTDYKLNRLNLNKDKCFPCPEGYKFNGASCVDDKGCLISQKSNGKYCEDYCPTDFYMNNLGNCVSSCKSLCDNSKNRLRVLMRSLEMGTLSSLLPAEENEKLEQLEEWSKREPEQAFELKANAMVAIRSKLAQLEAMKVCNWEVCDDFTEIYKIINKSGAYCEAGEVAFKNECVKKDCLKCAQALESQHHYDNSSRRYLKCGSQDDEEQIRRFLNSEKSEELRERKTLCEMGRKDICIDFRPVFDEDFSKIAKQRGLNCDTRDSISKPSFEGRQ